MLPRSYDGLRYPFIVIFLFISFITYKDLISFLQKSRVYFLWLLGSHDPFHDPGRLPFYLSSSRLSVTICLSIPSIYFSYSLLICNAFIIYHPFISFFTKYARAIKVWFFRYYHISAIFPVLSWTHHFCVLLFIFYVMICTGVGWALLHGCQVIFVGSVGIVLHQFWNTFVLCVFITNMPRISVSLPPRSLIQGSPSHHTCFVCKHVEDYVPIPLFLTHNNFGWSS